MPRTHQYSSTRFALLVAATLMSVAGPASVALAGPDIKTITIEGTAPGADRNAMEQAKQDAFRRAVEQACGTFINGQTETKNYAVVYDKVLSQAMGYIESYEVLEQRVDAGVSRCKVTAKVSTTSFEREWARLAHTLEAEGNPRCVVIVVEDNDADDANPPRTNGVVQSILENFLLDKGVQLMDKGAAEQMRSRDVTLAALNDDVGKLAAMAASMRADVFIKGNAEARRAGGSTVADRDVYKWNATLNIRAYHADSAQMLASNSYTFTHSTVKPEGAGDEALRKCVEQNAGRVLRDIGEAWRKRQNVRRSAQVTLENCSRADYKAFEAALRRVDGVQEVRLREMVGGTCQVDVEWSYDLETLVGRIEQLDVDHTRYEITEQTHDRVTVKLVKQSP